MDARLACHQFGGIIPLPGDQTFFEKLFNDSRQRKRFETTCSNTTWVPVIRLKYTVYITVYISVADPRIS